MIKMSETGRLIIKRPQVDASRRVNIDMDFMKDSREVRGIRIRYFPDRSFAQRSQGNELIDTWRFHFSAATGRDAFDGSLSRRAP